MIGELMRRPQAHTTMVVVAADSSSYPAPATRQHMACEHYAPNRISRVHAPASQIPLFLHRIIYHALQVQQYILANNKIKIEKGWGHRDSFVAITKIRRHLFPSHLHCKTQSVAYERSEIRSSRANQLLLQVAAEQKNLTSTTKSGN